MAGDLRRDVLVHAGEEAHHRKRRLAKRRRAKLLEDVPGVLRRRDGGEQVDVGAGAEEVLRIRREVGRRL